MFAYCGNNPVAREDDGGEFWNVVIGTVVGAVVGAAMGAAAEMADQLINYYAFGEELDVGDVLIGALEGAVYGGVMAATGSNTVASLASSVTGSIASGIYHGDSLGEIVNDTITDAVGETITCVTPKVVNKCLSGKYLKLGKFGKAIKKITDEPYVGKYLSRNNYLPDSIESSIMGFGEDLLGSAYDVGVRLIFP